MSLVVAACTADTPKPDAAGDKTGDKTGDKPGDKPASGDDKSAEGLEHGVDRAGSDMRDFDLDRADPLLCRQACLDEANCKAFTYVKPGVQAEAARCWLKDTVPEKIAQDCCVSGVK